MINKEEIATIGKFQKTHSLKGELNMICDIDSEYFEEGNPLIVEDDGILVPYFVESIRPKGSTSYLVKLDGINSEEEASDFVNKEIFILKKDAENWFEDDIVTGDSLIGFKILDEDTKKEIGVLKYFDDSTSNHLFIVENDEGDTIYLPANEDLINEINEDGKFITMVLPGGIIDLNKKENK